MNDPIFLGAVKVTFEVHGQEEAKVAVNYLVQAATPFAVVPLPDNNWEFTIKQEFAERWVDIVNGTGLQYCWT